MPKNVTTEPDGASPNVLAELTDSDLDQKIGAKIQMIGSALEGRRQCEKSAILSAWRLGQFLIEKKNRLAHGEWLPWLYALPHVSPTSATTYMRLARQIGSAADLGPSIRATLELLPAPAAAKPKSEPTIAVEIFKPATATPKAIAVKIVKPDLGIEPDAETIGALEKELYGEREKVADLEERNSIMEEAADPEIRKAVDKLNNQTELIKTLKASVAEWQSKHADARREISALKRQIRALETELGRRRPRHAA